MEINVYIIVILVYIINYIKSKPLLGVLAAVRKELLEAFLKVVNLLSEEEKKLALQKLSDSPLIPVTIFSGKQSGLEALVFFLKQHQRKTIKEIALLLNREPSTIYNSLSHAAKKAPIKTRNNPLYFVPITIFTDRKFSILESLVWYLKEKERLNLQEIAKLLNKHYSTIKTVYWRYKQKC